MDLRPKESSLTAYLGVAVKKRSGQHWKTETTAGDQDWLIMLPGPVYGHLELKRRNEKPRANQRERLDEMRAAGAYAGWTDSPSGVDAFLDGLAGLIPQKGGNA